MPRKQRLPGLSLLRVIMSFRFCLGASGAGKSTYLHRETVRRAGDALARLDLHENYMILVPDQFTMQTQKDLVLAAGGS